jgi:hypothetical protein
MMILVVLMLFARKLPNFTNQINQILTETGVDKYKRGEFDEARQDSLRKTLAGFWTWDDTGAGDRAARLCDRIEVKDNGIIWQVQQYWIRLPSGDTTAMTLVHQAFLTPFAWLDQQQKILVCEVRILKKVRISGRDTCYIPAVEKTVGMSEKEASYYPTMESTWHITVNDGRFNWEGREYTSWGSRDLSLFFPKGAVKLVDDIRIVQCSGKSPDRVVLREKIAADVATDIAATRTNADIARTLQRYYLPYCLQPLLRDPTNPGIFPLQQANVSMTVNWQGIVDTAQVVSRQLNFNDILRTSIEKEIREWRFNPLPASKPSSVFTCAITILADTLAGTGLITISTKDVAPKL